MAFMRTGRGSFTRCLLLSSAVILSIAPSRASVMRFLAVEELADHSSQVVRARITGQTTHWTPNHEGIFTEIEAVVLGEMKWDGGAVPGSPAQGRRITIIQAGGTIDGFSLDWNGRPTFRYGEDLVLFLAPYEPSDPQDRRLLVVGGKQGRMRVLSDAQGSPVMVERDLMGVQGAPFIEGDTPKGPPPRQDRIPWDVLREKVRAGRGGAR